jgi:hypothetical protein
MTEMDQFVASFARAVVDKVGRERPNLPIMTATALSIDTTIDAYPHVRCHIDGNPAGQVDIVPIATGSDWEPGQRIIVIYTHPAGAWAIGPTPVPTQFTPIELSGEIDFVTCESGLVAASIDLPGNDIAAGMHTVTLTVTPLANLNAAPNTVEADYTFSGPDSFNNTTTGGGGASTPAVDPVVVGPDSLVFTGGTYDIVIGCSATSAFTAPSPQATFDLTIT